MLAATTAGFALAAALRARRTRPAAILAPLLSSHAWALALAVRPETRFVVKLGGGGAFGDVATALRRPWGRAKLQAIFGRADAVVVPGEAMVDEVIAAGCPRARVHHIPNGVDRDRFRPACGVADGDGARDAANEAQTALFVGRLAPEKGADRLPAIWMGMPPDARLRVVGDGILAPRLAAWAQATPGVVLVGRVVDTVPEYRRSRVLVAPSRSEGIANVLLEALASGLSVVASDIPQNRELAARFAGALRLVAEDDASAWQDAVKEFFERPVSAADDAVAAYSLVRVAALYERVLGMDDSGA